LSERRFGNVFRSNDWAKRTLLIKTGQHLDCWCRIDEGHETKGCAMTKQILSIQTYLAARRERIREDGATAVEYGLMVGLMTLSLIIGVTAFGSKVVREYNSISNTLPSA
jgi:pilus assembly protein Flp/PilA